MAGNNAYESYSSGKIDINKIIKTKTRKRKKKNKIKL